GSSGGCWCYGGRRRHRRRNSRSHCRGNRRRRRRCYWRCCSRRRRGTRNRYATNNIDRINAPTLIGATGVAGHPPAQRGDGGKNKWQVDHGRDEALRVAAPCLMTGNRTTSIGADSSVIAAHDEATAGGKDVLKCISTISADF